MIQLRIHYFFIISAEFTYSLNMNGYIIFDELILQWVQIPIGASNSSLAYTINFKITPFIGLISPYDSSNSGGISAFVSVYAKTINTFEYRIGYGSYSTSIYKGYALFIGN